MYREFTWKVPGEYNAWSVHTLKSTLTVHEKYNTMKVQYIENAIPGEYKTCKVQYQERLIPGGYNTWKVQYICRVQYLELKKPGE